jgi:hypothetical protein
MTRRRRLALSVLALSAVLTLAGCTPDLWFLGGGGAGDSSGSGEPTPATTGTGDDAEESDSGAGACPVGDWSLDNASWAAALQALWQTEVPGAEVAVNGVLDLDWRPSGDYLLTASDSEYVVTGVTDGADFTQTVTHDGTESGTWTAVGTAADAEYTLAATDSTGMTSIVTLAAGGGVYSVDQSEVASDPWSGTMTVACTAGGMTTTVTEASGSLTVAWVRR